MKADLRKIAVQYMYDMAKIEWTSTALIDYSFNNEKLVYHPGKKYLGMIYNDGKNGLEAFKKALDENGTYVLDDIGWTTAPGNSCATSIKHAWQMISPDVEYRYSIDMMPYYKDTGVLPIGDIDWSTYDEKNTTNSILNVTDKDVIMEAYALALPADAFMRYLDKGGHALMVTLEPVVVRDEEGKIDPENSFVFLTDQNNLLNTLREYPSSWKVDNKLSFEKAYSQGWLPVTVRTLQDMEAPDPTFALDDANVSSNYCMMTIRLEITDADGKMAGMTEVHPYTRTFEVEKLKELAGWEGLADGEYKLEITVTVGLGSHVCKMRGIKK